MEWIEAYYICFNLLVQIDTSKQKTTGILGKCKEINLSF